MKKKFAATLLFALNAAQAVPQKLAAKEFSVCKRKVKLEVAKSIEERTIGLMDRDGIPAGTGMIFVFDRPDRLTFWMKNVPFDIDIGFFNAKGNIQNFLTMKGTSPVMQDEALPRYQSTGPALYAIELPKGFFSAKDKKNCRLSPLP